MADDIRFSIIVDGAARPVAEWDEDDAREALLQLAGSSASSFASLKTRFLSYLRTVTGDHAYEHARALLAEISYRDLDLKRLIDGQLFSSAEHLVMQIDTRVATIISQTGEDPDAYLMPRVSLYLAWIGLSQESAAVVRKDNVSDNGATISCGDCDYVVPLRMRFDIIRFKRANKARILSGTNRTMVEIALPESDLLLRTTRSVSLNQKQIVDSIYSLNRNAISSLRFSYSNVSLSGRFVRAIEDERINGSFYDKPVGGRRWWITDTERASILLGDIKTPNSKKIYAVLPLYDAYKRSVIS